ncbi:MAG: hypothetical protein ACI4SF_15860 [Oscillospiraceae bacterium]
MSKTYFGRCAAVGIAGLTAMSSIAIVASAATQASAIYQLEYKQISNIGMLNNSGYATGTNQFCKGDATKLNSGFVVDLSSLTSYTTTYTKKTNSGGTVTSATDTIAAADVWGTDSFDNVAFVNTGKWTYKEYNSAYTLAAAALEEVYDDRGTGLELYFKSESERSAAKSAMISKIKTEYGTLANKAYAQFVKDIDAAKAVALANIDATYQTEYNAAVAEPDATDKSVGIANATAKRTAAKAAVNSSATTIKNEFRSAFAASNFRIESDGFVEKNVAIEFGTTFAGVTTTATFGGNDLAGAKYYSVSTKYNNDTSYAFKGEVQLKDDYVAGNANALCINGNDWLNFEVINYTTSSGGNTPASGDSTSDTSDTTTTTTTWYPDSAAYRAASEVSYLGENGVWYTSASAATLYGGGYTGTSKSSNYSTISSAADGKTIYFDSTSGTYTTSATSYSYVVKEGTSTTDTPNDPYYTYFFGTSNTTTTTTVPAGSPAISGASKYAGWTNITAYITNKAKSGATYTINMNDGTVVPSAVLEAAKAKNVTLVFANDNGSKVTVKPGKISSGTDLNVAVTYNVKDVKTSLVTKAKKVNPGTVSTAQIRVGNDGSLGGTATVNVKFSTSRAGCTVKAYRLTESGSLVKEATGTVASTGRVNLNLTKGGSYLLVVIDD